MTGAWRLYAPSAPVYASACVVLDVDGARAMCLRAPIARVIPARRLRLEADLGTGSVAALGPDLLGETFDTARALALLRRENGVAIGEAVMKQRVVAGIGNVYKSELLHIMHFAPRDPVAAFADAELTEFLLRARALMQQNTVTSRTPHLRQTRGAPANSSHGMTSPGALVYVYRRRDRACFACGASIQCIRQGEAQRSTYFCPSCQSPRRPRKRDSP